jgi:hypothetical protein
MPPILSVSALAAQAGYRDNATSPFSAGNRQTAASPPTTLRAIR